MKRLFLPCLVSLYLLRTIHAGEQPLVSDASDFRKGAHELEGLTGYFTSVDTTIPGPIGRPSLQTALATLRYGWMLNDQRQGIFFGNEEFLLEGFAGPVTHGPGSFLAGGTFLLRHNFVWGSHPIFVPYLQLGAGLVGSDASSDHSQFSIGTPVEFNLQSSLGARWRLNRAWSINTEFNYRHISNAGLSSRNGGYDLLGGFVGLGRMF